MTRIAFLLAVAVAACTTPPGGVPDAVDAADTLFLSSSTSPDAPEWAKDAVWYQVFPERFRNGDPSNDPTAEVVALGWPFRRIDGWKPSRWTSDWYAQNDWEKATG